MKRYIPLFESFPITPKQAYYIKELVDEFVIETHSKKDRQELFVKIIDALAKHKLKYDNQEILKYLKKIS